MINKDDFLFSVIIPVYNEEATIKEILDSVICVPFRKEIIVVDDGSTDGTYSILDGIKNTAIRIYRHDRNYGKGSALKTGISKANGDVIVIQDADLEYNPAEYPVLIDPILKEKADVVYGSRFAGYGEHRVLYFWHYLGNRFLTLLSNIFTNLNLTDMETGYKAFTREVLKDIDINEKRFGFEQEITTKIAKKMSASTRSLYHITAEHMLKAKKSSGATACGLFGVFCGITFLSDKAAGQFDIVSHLESILRRSQI